MSEKHKLIAHLKIHRIGSSKGQIRQSERGDRRGTKNQGGPIY